MTILKRSSFTLFLLFAFFQGICQKQPHYSSAEILERLKKLNVLGNVLYIAAHPDDENTGMITYMANEAKLNTVYFSCTRGDGGQNLIGPEFGDQLGVIRTQELLAARRVDHGVQFFSRAVDFGYSKNPDETFAIWNKKEVLGDLVWIIRKFRPDIMINRFNTVPGGNHGHHTASAILAAEAFDLAADPSSYPEQLAHVKVWQPGTLYWNTYPWFRSDYQRDTSELLSVDIGKYNAVLGMSYSEISALSRSNHKSQGFGATGSRGDKKEYLQYEKGIKAEKSIFELANFGWSRVDGGAKMQKSIDAIIASYRPENPSASLSGLLELRKNVTLLHDDFWKEIKTAEIDELILAVTGLYLDINATDYSASPGDSLLVNIEAVNRSPVAITVDSIVWADGTRLRKVMALKNNKDEQFQYKYRIPTSTPYSQPYWLVEDHEDGLFKVTDQQNIGRAQNPPAIESTFFLTIQGQRIGYKRPVVSKRNDPVKGETYRPFIIVPPAFVSMNSEVVLFGGNKPEKVTVSVRAGKSNFSGNLQLSLPAGWLSSPEVHEVASMSKGEERQFEFDVTPPAGQQIATGMAILTSDGQKYNYGYTELAYDHIPTQVLLPVSSAKFVRLDIQKGNEKIGYLTGPGDDVPGSLTLFGYSVSLINELEWSKENLDVFDVIILGVRSLNTEERLRTDMEKLFEFVRRGGKLIVQYNNNQGILPAKIAPFDLKLSRDRVTDEHSEVQFLSADHPVLLTPNVISKQDFDGWVQERGLYFPSTRDAAFQTIVAMSDKGEPSIDSGILIADYGQGKYIYTSLSWFRQLPAGVPGAYRLFANLISLK